MGIYDGRIYQWRLCTNMRLYERQKEENRIKINQYVLSESSGNVDFYPAYIQIEQTNRCNAECIMCNHFYLGNRGGADLSPAVIAKIEPILPYCETIMLNGDGEPFLCSSIEDNIKLFNKYGVKIGTNTNMCFVPDGLWQFFADTFGFLNISCDGATAETFEMIRRGLKWDIFLSNLARLRDSAPLLKKNFDCVVSKQNVKDLPDIVKLAAAYGIHAVRFHRLGVNPCIGNETDQAEYYYEILREHLDLARIIGNDLGVAVDCPSYQATVKQIALPTREEMINEISERKIRSFKKMGSTTLADDYYSQTVSEECWSNDIWLSNKVCQWGIERCYIDIQGNITTCCFNMKKNMGSLKNMSFDEIWNGWSYIEFRKLMAKKMLPGFCKNCNWIKEAKF